MFDLLGRIVARRWIWVLALWVVGVTALKLVAPPWKTISQDDDVGFFPADFPSVRGYRMLQRAFQGDAAGSEAVIVVQRPDAKLSAADQAFIRELARRIDELRKQFPERDYRLSPVETFQTPVKGQLLASKDGRASLLLVPCGWPFMAEKVIQVIDHLRRTANEMRARGEIPPGLDVAVTGSTGVGADIQKATKESLDRSQWTTILLVVVILLAVYRSPVVALIPLVTITISVITSMSLMALLTRVPGLNFQVMKITDIFVIVVLFGAGTDYCLFLIARYREELTKGSERAAAVHHAVRDVGGALAASAGTVVCGLGMMIFAEFVKIRYTGPAVAISLSVALVACLTLAPALLRAWGRVVFWPFHPQPATTASSDPERTEFGTRLWEQLSHTIARRPLTIWGTSVLVMVPFAIWGLTLAPNYDFLAELSRDRESRRGSQMIQQHFAPGELGALAVLLDGKSDLTTPAGRQAIADLTDRLAKLSNVSYVRSLSRPIGQMAAEPAPAEPPPAAAQNPLGALMGQFRNATDALRDTAILNHYVSQSTQRRTTRFDVIFNVPPFSYESMALLENIRALLDKFTAEPNHALSGAEFGLAGTPANLFDLRRITISDQWRVNWLVVAGVLVVLFLLLRRPGTCVYLLLTVLFSYYATLGVTEGVFRLLAHYHGEPFLGLDWKVEFFLFVILVAVGEDYNIFLMARVIEEQQKFGAMEGVRVAVARTGGIITSCGMIMAGTFGSMATGSLSAIIELGFALAFGVLLDTFIVRPILVPSLLIAWGRHRDRMLSFRPATVTAVERPAEPVAR
jgi:RND superfamily putative drug exporter